MTLDETGRPTRAWRRRAADAAANAALRAIVAAFAVVPTDLSSAIGGFLGAKVGPRLYPAAHRRIVAMMRTLRPDLAGGEAAAIASSRLWNALGRVYAEFATEHRLWREGRVRVECPEIPRAVAESGRPLIVAGLHTGNWELLPITLAYLGHNIIQVYQPQASPALEGVARGARLRSAREIAARRRVTAADLFRLVPPSPRAGLHLTSAIRSGWTGVIFVDDDPGGRCVSPNLFGAPRMDGNLLRVVRLAQAADAVILPAFVERTEGARFAVRFLPPIERGSRDETAARLNAALAEPARRLLDQWFMLPSYRPPG